MSTPSIDLATGSYTILNLSSGEYVLRGNNLGDGLRTGPYGFGTAVFRVTQVGDNAQIFYELDTKWKPISCLDTSESGLSVIWGDKDDPWVFRATGPGQLNLGRIPEQPDTFWANVDHNVLLEPIGPSSDWRLVPAGDAK